MRSPGLEASRNPAWFALGVAGTIVLAVALAAMWALRTPFFMQPDERGHLDYAFGFFDAGRPFRAVDATPLKGATAQQAYVYRRIGFRKMRYNPAARVPAGYGTAAYIADFDRHAPRPSGVVPPPGAQLPYIAFLYPGGYYALVAIAMRIADAMTSSLWTDIMTARFVGVGLLALTLLASVPVFRRAGFTRGQTLLALFCIGCFPLTSWVAGYVQPDNLSFFLVTVFLWLALRWQRRPSFTTLVPPVLAIGALFFTKQHYALCCWAALVLAAVPVLCKAPRASAVGAGALLLALPALCFKLSFAATYAPGMSYATQTFTSANSTLGAGFAPLARGIVDGVRSSWFGGDSFSDYWLRFGMRGETLFPASVAYGMRPWLVALMAIAFAAAGFAQYRILSRIEKVARRSKLTALRLVLANLPLNLYVLTAMLLIFNYVRSHGLIWIEGRYWLPITAAYLVLFARIGYVARRPLRRRVQYATFGALAAFGIVSSAAGLGAIGRVYYEPPAKPLGYDYMAEILRVESDGKAAGSDAAIRTRKGTPLVIDGYAIDPRTGLPARSVIAKLDRTRSLSATVGLPEANVAGGYSDDLLLNSGFRLRVPTQSLAPGAHSLQLFVLDPALGALPLRTTVVFTVS